MAAKQVLQQWARLVRIPTVFTILADVSAAYFLTAAGHQPVGRWLLVVLAGVCLYWAGMIFNDVFDIEQDRRERPGRPLPSGAISRRAASLAGGGLMLGGIVLATLSGWLPVAGYEGGWLPACVAVILAAAVLLYDGPLKATPVAPVAMGGCRMLSFLLGASPVVAAAAGPELSGVWGQVFPTHIWGAAAGMGVYVMGVTLFARQEANVSSRAPLVGGLIVMTLGLIVIAMVPRLAAVDVRLAMPGEGRFGLLIALLGATVLVRGVMVLGDPQPRRVQLTVRAALLTLIPLSAALALLGAGPPYGLAVLALMLPALVVGARFRMT
jgi:4-hydroxybenzoate polyprenyltransferase